jgi:phosphoglycolate phosphatase
VPGAGNLRGVSTFLVLWDVDYTLVDTPGVGRQLYQLAFAELYGHALPAVAAEANMAGRTDRAIALDVLSLAGVPDPRAQVSVFEAALTRLAPDLTAQVAASGRALPGAAAALAALADGAAMRIAGGQARQSLLTGNVRALAEVKLAPLGLTTHLDLDVGAYGNEHEIRAELVHLARDRAAAAYGTDPGAFDGQATVLVGDTPLDVEAALSTGARAVGVATGRFSELDLEQAGAHAVLPDLADTAKVLTAIFAGRS